MDAAALRLAMIGTGHFARRHLEMIGRDSDVAVDAHLGNGGPSGPALAADYGGEVFSDLDTLIATARPDIAIVTVPPHQHGEIEAKLVAARIPFLVEKPIATDRQTAETIAAAIEKAGLVVGVGYNLRAMDVLGEVRQALSAHPVRMVIGEYLTRTPGPLWWRRNETSGGQLVEQATHLVDLALHLLGPAVPVAHRANPAPTRHFEDADVASTQAMLIEFGDGTPGVFTTACVLDKTESLSLRIIAEHLLVSIDLTGATLTENGETRRLSLVENAYRIQDRAFLAAVRANDPSILTCSYADALRTHRLLMDATGR
ncbi:MAG: Gfo/Idh/MocA family protein [Devosia sp.]